MEAVQAHFRPEFLNRLDEIILFQSLSLEQIESVVEIQLSLLRKRLAERKLSLVLSEEAEKEVALAGYDPVYGARPLKRAIQKLIVDPLSQKLLAGEFQEGDVIFIDADEEGVFYFHKQEEQERI